MGRTDPSLRFFISYAREDHAIAIAVSNAIQSASGPAAEVFMDVALQFGVDFQQELRKRLDNTDVLIVINSSILKPAYGYTGLELGYFMHVMQSDTDAGKETRRRIVPIYLEKPADAVADRHGVYIGISRETLNMTITQYEATLADVDFGHTAVRFLRQYQELIATTREKQGLAMIPLSDEQRDLPGLAKKLQLAIFSHLKSTPDLESNLKPQLQIVLTTSDDALAATPEGQLPADALLTSVGAGRPLAIFGLSATATTWADFLKNTTGSKFRDSWADAITTVIISSLRSQFTTDNTQVIVAQDEKTAYRVILTTGIRYFNGKREFNLYFVESLKRPDYGDPDTTRLLNGLELCCRFRSMFLERNSEFSAVAARLAKRESLSQFAVEVQRELNLLTRDALQTGLDNVGIWIGLIDDPNRLIALSQAWGPIEVRLREVLAQIRRAEGAGLEQAKGQLVTVLDDLERTMRPLNGALIAEMADKLKTVFPEQKAASQTASQ